MVLATKWDEMPSLAQKINPIRKTREWLAADDYFNGKVLGSYFVGILAITLLVGALLFSAMRDHRNDSLRARTLEVLRLTNKVENDLNNLETGYRGYLLTGQEQYLQPFEPRKAMLLSRLDELDTLVKADPRERQHVPRIRQGIEQWLSQTVIPGMHEALGKAPQSPEAISPGEVLRSTLGNTLLEDARKYLQNLQDDEQAAVRSLTKDQQFAGASFEVLVYAPKLESVISEMEKAKWGYLLTGQKTSLASYQNASSEYDVIHGHLAVLLSDNPAQLALLAKIDQQLDQWRNEAALPQIEARQTRKDVVAVVAQSRGKEMMDKVHTAVTDFDRAQEGVYRQANFRAETGRIARTAGFSALCVVAMGFLVASSWYSFAAYRKHLRKIASSEAQTRSIIETTMDGVLTMNAQGLVQSMNPAAEKMFGYKASEMIGKGIVKLIPQRLLMHDMTNLGRGSIMAVGHRQNYYPFPIEISLSEMKVSGAKVYVALIRDVSARKRSEETLRHIGLGVSATTGEEFVRSLVKQLSKALQSDFAFVIETVKTGGGCSMIIAEHGNIRRKANYKLTNTICEEVLKKGFRAYPSGVREKFPNDEILNELKVESFVAMPLTDHKGVPVGVMGVLDTKEMEDIQIAESTLQIFAARAGAEIERKRFEEDLAAEKERLAVTLRSIGDGFITTDMNGKILLLNKVAEKLTGWPQDQAIGEPLVNVFNLLNERTRTPSQNAVERIIETGSVVGAASHAVIVSRDGSERLIENSASPIRDKANRKVGVVLVFRDITEKQKAEEERRKAEKLESLGIAAGGIAHDFNNLLTAIIGNLSLSLLTLDPEEDIHTRLASAKKAALRAQDLAQQLLTFAKGGAPLKKTASIGQLIRETVTTSLNMASIRTHIEMPTDLWSVEIDSGQISQVITNVANNAQESMPAGGAVTVICNNFTLNEELPSLAPLRPGNYIRISVQDEGIGIPEEYIKKIFDPYFTTKPRASGLGLATSYSIIKNHDGLITVESSAGSGSLFTIYLPASDKELSMTKPLTIPDQPYAGRGKILVIDDEEAICALVSHALTPMGFTVTETHDGAEAIKVYQEARNEGDPFVAVISDLTIPGGMGGQEAIKRLREIEPSIRAIVSSGYATDPVMSRYQEYGFVGCIAKPYEISDLCRIVQEVVESSQENMVYHDFVQSQLA